MQPSKYQAAVYDWVRHGEGNAVVDAVAGSGKTSTGVEALKCIDPSASVLFLAFNRHIAAELKGRVPSNVRVATLNSFGWGAVMWRCPGATLDDQKVAKTLKRRVFGLGVDSFAEVPANTEAGNRRDLWPGVYLSPDAADLIRDYHSASEFARRRLWKGQRAVYDRLVGLLRATGARDALGWQAVADAYGADLGEVDRNVIDLIIAPLYDAVINNVGVFDFDDQCFMPVCHGWPTRRFDWVIGDEIQDWTATQTRLALKALGRNGRFLGFGDPHQCQPAGTMVEMEGGERKPIESIQEGDRVVSWDRRGGSIVGRVAQARRVIGTGVRHYAGRMFTVRAGGKSTRCTPNHRWVSRFIDRETDLWCVYMMRKGGRYRIGWCQLFTSQGCFHLGQRARIERADAAWILSVHRDKTEASIQESHVATVYGLPLLPFMPVHGAMHLTADSLGSFWSKVEGEVHAARARGCLDDFGRDHKFPFYEGGYERRGRTTVFETQACNLIPEIMAVPVDRGTKTPEWCPIGIEANQFSGDVYSLGVESHETYIADGLVTHNSIYGFRGADFRSIPNIVESTRATVLPLSVCYRCPAAVVEEARSIVPHVEPAPGAKAGAVDRVKVGEFAAAVRPGDYVLCRTTAPLVEACFDQLRRGKPATVKGRDIGQGLIALVERIATTDPKGDPEMAMPADAFLRRATDWRDDQTAKLIEADKEDQIATVLDKFETLCVFAEWAPDVAGIVAKIGELFRDDNDRGRIVFATVHRAKGLQAPTVYVLRPELMPFPGARTPEQRRQEKNLKYVAITRAQDRLVWVESEPKDAKQQGGPMAAGTAAA